MGKKILIEPPSSRKGIVILRIKLLYKDILTGGGYIVLPAAENKEVNDADSVPQKMESTLVPAKNIRYHLNDFPAVVLINRAGKVLFAGGFEQNAVEQMIEKAM